jgi:hypothetical protein
MYVTYINNITIAEIGGDYLPLFTHILAKIINNYTIRLILETLYTSYRSDR